MVGVSIPLVPMQHQYAITGSLSELAGGVSMPNLRDPDKLVYYRQDGQSLVLGGYERNPAAFDVDAIAGGSNTTVLRFYPSRFVSLLVGCIESVTSIQCAELCKQGIGFVALAS